MRTRHAGCVIASVFTILLAAGLQPAPKAVAVTSVPGHIAPLTATSFNMVGGNLISGWYWMRSPGYTDAATWTFSGFNPTAMLGQRVFFTLSPLVTQAASGGAGWTARLKATVFYDHSAGTVHWAQSVTTMNPFPLRTVADSSGLGYQNFGSFVLSGSYFRKGAGTLRVEVRRDPMYSLSGYHPHVALNSDSLKVYYTQP